MIKFKESSFCESIPANSYSVICQVADKAGTTPESVSGILKLANLGALNKLYTAQQANTFIGDLIADIHVMREVGSMTYADFVAYCTGQHGRLSKEVQAVFIILEDFVEVDVPEIENRLLSGYDYQWIETHLRKQQAIVALYL
jgi:hypothetical protein